MSPPSVVSLEAFDSPSEVILEAFKEYPDAGPLSPCGMSSMISMVLRRWISLGYNSPLRQLVKLLEALRDLQMYSRAFGLEVCDRSTRNHEFLMEK